VEKKIEGGENDGHDFLNRKKHEIKPHQI